MTRETTVVTVRLAPDEVAAVDAIAAERRCSRSEAVRLALTFGVPLASKGVAVNIAQIALLLEYIQAGVDVIVTREHADFAERLEQIAHDRVAQYHA